MIKGVRFEICHLCEYSTYKSIDGREIGPYCCGTILPKEGCVVPKHCIYAQYHARLAILKPFRLDKTICARCSGGIPASKPLHVKCPATFCGEIYLDSEPPNECKYQLEQVMQNEPAIVDVCEKLPVRTIPKEEPLSLTLLYDLRDYIETQPVDIRSKDLLDRIIGTISRMEKKDE